MNFETQEIKYAPIDENFSVKDKDNVIYPSKENPSRGFIIHRNTTLDFNHNENFVCLVCVHLLLIKEYEPKHIVLEPAFKVGHKNKPSYGDVLVFDKEYNPLVLIENKTYGAEFSKEWNNMQKDGGQLFSYLGPLVNQLGFCKNLVLFAADFEEQGLVTKSHIITLTDNEKRIAELEHPKTFINAQGQYFDVWNETYGKSFETKGLFEKDIVAYSIGKQKYTINDLKSLSHAEIKPIYHEFATILRNHAITDFEHSFYILIDLFLCKITDERNNPDDLKFYYKGIARDTPKEYCERLLKLYQLGKKQLFDVDVVNKEESDIRQIFDDTNRSLTNGLFKGIKELFEEIKFYNIKKFNFIDVENKEEFELNFQILIKIAALIQDINLSSSETNHFFGDLFEGLLSKNVHQTEGQFFTPIPIVNFIIKSLPEFPDSVKVLDYACGAGHFLTEFVKTYPNSAIYGIEKSQPLSQVAKIAAIINGAKDVHIIFKDALSSWNTKEKRFDGFNDENFDIIIANPPYSVKGFLNTLTNAERNQFELVQSIDEKAYETNGSIECFFIERSKQFLKKNGLMGIILPSSILSNGSLYKKTRELLFAHFNILAIASMGSKTFGSTGTNTVILFAQKVKKNSEGMLHAFIEKKDYTQYTNYQTIDAYIEMQGYEREDYFAFMQDGILSESLENHENFVEYKVEYKKKFKGDAISENKKTDWFVNSSFCDEALRKKSKKSKEYKKRYNEFIGSAEYRMQEQTENRRQFFAFAKEIESDKLNTFIQIADNRVALLQSPPEKINGKTNDEEIVRFLGYSWGGRKGYEGIKYKTDAKDNKPDGDLDTDDAKEVAAVNSIKYIVTALYNPNNAWDRMKFAFAFRKHIYEQCHKFSFGENEKEIEASFDGKMSGLLSYAKLPELIDFRRANFDKVIKLTADKKIEIVSKYPLVKVGDICKIYQPKTISRNEMKNEGKYKVFGANGVIGHYDKYNHEFSEVVMGCRGTCGIINLTEPKSWITGNAMVISPLDQKSLSKLYLKEYLTIANISQVVTGKEQPQITKTNLSPFLIPLPPIDIQQQIVSECEMVDEEYNNRRKSIEEYKEKILEIINEVKGAKQKLKDVAPYTAIRIAYSKTESKNYVTTDNLLQNCEGMKIYDEVPNVDSVISYKVGDILVSNIRPYLKKIWLADRDGGCSPDVLVFRPVNGIDSRFVYYSMKQDNFFEYMMLGTKGVKMPRGDKNNIPNFEIPVPSLSEQQRIVSEIESYEAKIAKAKAVMEGCAERKKQILDKWLY